MNEIKHFSLTSWKCSHNFPFFWIVILILNYILASMHYITIISWTLIFKKSVDYIFLSKNINLLDNFQSSHVFCKRHRYILQTIEKYDIIYIDNFNILLLYISITKWQKNKLILGRKERELCGMQRVRLFLWLPAFRPKFLLFTGEPSSHLM